MEKIPNQQRSATRKLTAPALFGFFGGTFAIGLIATIAQKTGIALLMAPLGASCVLLFLSPDSAQSHPKNLVFGHFIACLIGIVTTHIGPAGPWQMALAVGLTIAAMYVTNTLHAPAGADPLVIMLGGNASIQLFLIPAMAGVGMLLVTAVIVNNCARRRRWPVSWWTAD